jgi:hypothetical protein
MANDIMATANERPRQSWTSIEISWKSRISPSQEFAIARGVRAVYEKAMGNGWRRSDSKANWENSLESVPAEITISALDAVYGS